MTQKRTPTTKRKSTRDLPDLRLEDAPDLMKFDEARSILRCGARQLYEAVRDDEIPHVKIRGAIRFPKAALVKWMFDGPERDATPGDEPGVADLFPQATIDQMDVRRPRTRCDPR